MTLAAALLTARLSSATKIQIGQAAGTIIRLTTHEREVVNVVLKDNKAEISESESDVKDNFLEDFALETRILWCTIDKPSRSLLHISPNSNVVERLLNRTGLIMRPNRKSTDVSWT